MEKLQVLKQYFGYDGFREGQELLIDSVLSHRDCLGVMPTGAGKSICFQVPSIMLDGITLVISPLISLMKDQVNALTQNGVKAAFINSSLTENQIRLALQNLRDGLYKIVYIAPERLEVDLFDPSVESRISMVTIDEAHCISQWGQDFRPSYLKIPEFINKLPKRPVISAFTATATPAVRQDILTLLELKDPTVLVTGFDRKNLFFSVEKPADKFTALAAFLESKKDIAGIIYCSTRKTVEEVCLGLINAGYNALRYHAGLSDVERRANQDEFLYDRAQIMVATNAFGMGIDKSNVGFVVHYNMPKDIESYYQEAGRAGRDGEPAECVLLYNGQDVRTNMYLIEKSLEDRSEELKERDRNRLKTMTFYCHTSDCLRAYILKYFGEPAGNYCGNCENCNSNFETTDVTVDAQMILSCVIRAKQRYGVKTIIDVLRGSKSEKITHLGLDNLSTYGISPLSEKRLRDIINHMVLNEFLYITDNKYPVLKQGPRAGEVLRKNTRVEMKLPKLDMSVKPRESTRLDRPVDNLLFEKLKALRLEIANAQNIPAFVVLADSSLIDMCIKRPTDSESFLEISGVGQVKLERYGKRFLEVISRHSETIEDTEENIYAPKSPELSDEPVSVSVIADRLNCALMGSDTGKLTGAKINEWLIQQGYLEIRDGSKLPTELGTGLGIEAEERVIRNKECFVNMYSRNAQSFITEHYCSHIL